MSKGAPNNPTENDRITAEEIAPYLSPPLSGTNVLVYGSLPSTNDTAKELAMAGAAAGTTVIAEKQTMGKGRNGRSFYSPPACGIYLSMILRPSISLSQLLLLTSGVAVASAKAIEEVNDCSVEIKWVNDLYLRGKKVAGILLESALGGGVTDYVVAGIGVNVTEPEEGFPAELAEKAGAVCVNGESLSRNRLAAGLINNIWAMAELLKSQSVAYVPALIDEVRRRSCVLGRDITITGAEGLSAGRAVEIDGQGFLVVEGRDGRRHTLSGGEVSITAF